jgi:concanavalin A-like lectin/glucanase superfamily protein
MPGLLFSGGTSNDRVNFGAFADMSVFSLGAWIYPAAAENRFIACTEGGSVNGFFWRLPVTNAMRLRVKHATTDAFQVTIDNTIVVNTWQYVGATFDASDSQDVRLFRGTLTSAVAECSYAAGGFDAVGARVSNGAANKLVGTDNTGTDVTFSGTISVVHIWSGRRLSAADFEQVRLNPAAVGPNCVVLTQLGSIHGTGSQRDYSGQANHGTVTGPTLSTQKLGLSIFRIPAPRPQAVQRAAFR